MDFVFFPESVFAIYIKFPLIFSYNCVPVRDSSVLCVCLLERQK